ncbi:SWIM zinc finger family protein [Massilia sp. PAMC28688]|uniref:SWIM zinc finger family protein n=1 Tax=Massilia sp. PAMC28688 TaxID=2861283 RepID=UPI001C62B2CF|nr:SWIM zinc finger family protein [Massilia sp. PAMC28688]QYF92232.1 SWIM zinc finger family protein [Massilia sp. PAMC28688]
MSLTADQILALAPDASSAKAGSAQASRAKWSGLGGHAQALWGLCQGSGKEPYRAQIDLAGPAFKCTCPSRKFPCKHGLGLYLLYAADGAAFTETALPAWVSDWFKSREQRSEKKAAKETQHADLSPQELAAKVQSQQKRQEKRQGNVESGLAVLDIWLADLAREGLAGLRSKSARDWEAIAARLVDTQAPGLASRVRRVGMLIYGSSTSGWEPEVAGELGQLALLADAYRRLPQLPEALAHDVKTAIGWSMSHEEVLAQPGIHDSWDVWGNHTQDDGRIARRACYLRGRTTGRWAMLLQFAAGSQPLPPPLLPGTCQAGTFHFYPGAVPLRAVMGDDVQLAPAHALSLDPPALAACLQHHAQALALNPFLDSCPMLLAQVTPAIALQPEEQMTLHTQDGEIVPLATSFRKIWHLHAIAGGHPVTLFGLWNGNALLPLSVISAGRMHLLDVERAA